MANVRPESDKCLVGFFGIFVGEGERVFARRPLQNASKHISALSKLWCRVCDRSHGRNGSSFSLICVVKTMDGTNGVPMN